MIQPKPFWCQNCNQRFAQVFAHRTLGAVCPVCLKPFQGAKKRRRSAKDRARPPQPITFEITERQFLSDHPGHPLGAGMPTGSPLRIEVWHEASQTFRGESHLMAWERLMRSDPCAYCGAPYAGTVDHIEPKSLPVRGIGSAFNWINVAGACESCNNSKGRLNLLEFLRKRANSMPKVALNSRVSTSGQLSAEAPRTRACPAARQSAVASGHA